MDFVKCIFLPLLIWSCGFFSLSSLTWWIALIDFWMLKQPRIPGIKPIWSWWVSLCLYLLKLCLGVLGLCSRGIMVCRVLFLWRPVSQGPLRLSFAAWCPISWELLFPVFYSVLGVSGVCWGTPSLFHSLPGHGGLLDPFWLHFQCEDLRTPGWLRWLSVWLQLRSWSRSQWVRALHRALCWHLRAWSLLWILCLPLSLPSPTRALCLLKIHKCLKKNSMIIQSSLYV